MLTRWTAWCLNSVMLLSTSHYSKARRLRGRLMGCCMGEGWFMPHSAVGWFMDVTVLVNSCIWGQGVGGVWKQKTAQLPASVFGTHCQFFQASVSEESNIFGLLLQTHSARHTQMVSIMERMLLFLDNNQLQQSSWRDQVVSTLMMREQWTSYPFNIHEFIDYLENLLLTAADPEPYISPLLFSEVFVYNTENW